VLHAVASEHANVVAIKYAHNDVAAFLALAAAVPARVTCACGSAERWALPFAAAGRVGYTSGIANFAPALTLEFWRAIAEDPAAARALWREIAPLEEIRAARNSAFNVSVVKHAMDMAGLVGGPVRPPLSPLDETMKASVAEIVRGWGDRLGFATETEVAMA
jgi:4-hydroxy-tetrahydrodipicolinate synthase